MNYSDMFDISVFPNNDLDIEYHDTWFIGIDGKCMSARLSGLIVDAIMTIEDTAITRNMVVVQSSDIRSSSQRKEYDVFGCVCNKVQSRILFELIGKLNEKKYFLRKANVTTYFQYPKNIGGGIGKSIIEADDLYSLIHRVLFALRHKDFIVGSN